MKIGILGLGFVGGAAQAYFQKQGKKVYRYDKYKHLGSVGEINRAELVLVCVPTPFHPQRGFTLSFVNDAIGVLEPGKIVVVKSSVIPGTTELLQRKFPQHKILFSPEFLREASAVKDFACPDRQIVGYTSRSKSAAASVLKVLPKAPFARLMPATEAEMVKYMANSFLSLKVVFANEFYELCKALGLDYNLIRPAVGADRRIYDSHLEVMAGGYRGYGGTCFPKDVNAILAQAKKKRVSMRLLKTMRQINRTLLLNSGLNEAYFLLEKHRRKKRL